MSVQPTSLSLQGNVLSIQWSDGEELRYDVPALRHNCPCATCNAERSRSAATGEPPRLGGHDVQIQQMAPVGNYAYKIYFTDGHDTGIYTLQLLWNLGRK